MRILAVDDEKLALEAMQSAIRKAEPTAEVYACRKVNEALTYAAENKVDVAFLDIEMGEISGVELAKKLKAEYPTMNIIFSTGYSSYQGEAFGMHVSGYIMKPVTKDKVKAELDNLRYPPEELKSEKRVRFKCFGNFEVFIDGSPMRFKYDKSKEMLAYLVSRSGALCSNGEIAAAIWEDDNDHESYFRNIRVDIKKQFDDAGIDNIIITQRGKTGINKDVVECDLYDLQQGKPYALNLYRGEYMEQYSWGEFSKGMFES